MPSLPEVEDREIWVNVTEAAQMIGYNREYLKKLILQLWKLPEDERPVQIRKRSSGFDLWFPDLLAYLREFGHGPYNKHNPTP